MEQPINHIQIDKMKIEQIVTKDAEGNNVAVDIKTYKKAIVEELKIKPLKRGEDEGDVAVEQIIDHVVKVVGKGVDAEEEIQNNYPELITRVKEDWASTQKNLNEGKENAKKEKEEEKAKKEEEKKAQEAKAAELKVMQEGLQVQIGEGVKLAESEFKTELDTFKSSLPESFVVHNEGEGWQLSIKDGASKEEIAQGFGYLLGKADNNQAMGNFLQFSVGDIVNGLVSSSVYETAKQAGEYVEKLMKDSGGRAFSPSVISGYAKMAERTPVALRNPRVHPTAYKAIADMALPKKGDKETDADFKVRLDAFKSGREELQKKLASGEVTDRGDVLPLVEEFQINQGLKKRKDESELSVTDHLKNFFFAQTALDDLLDVHEEDHVVYREGEKLHKLTREQLIELRDESKANLVLAYYEDKKNKITYKDLVNGKKEIVTKNGAINAEGKKEDKVDIVNLYPKPFWKVEEETKPEEAAATEGNEAKKEEAATA